MKVLVTGGNGFIGGYVAEELFRRGYTPIIFDRYKRDTDFIAGNIFLGDITSPVDCTEAMAHCDAFIHLAAVLGTQETIDNPTPAATTNILGGLNVLDGAAQYRVPGVYIGVGNHWMNNTYSITKTCIERFIDMYNKHRGTCINIVRAMNAYGPGQVPAAPYGPAKVRKITPSFVCRALRNDDIEIYGDGSQVSDMVYVKDVAFALVNSMELACGSQHHEPAECGPPFNNTVNEVAELVIELTGSASRIIHLPMRPGEIPNSTVSADTSTLEDLGMQDYPFVPLPSGLIETIAYFEEYLKK